MIRLAVLVLVAQLLCLGLASPVRTSRANNVKASKWSVTDLKNEFKGIYWNHIIEDETDCTPEQLDRIIWSTRAAMWLVEGPPKDMEYAYSTAWTRYFGNYKNWLLHGKDVKRVADEIQHNILHAAKYPREGHRTSTSGLKKMHYTCKYAAHPFSTAVRSCDEKNSLAVTIESKASEFHAWTVAFCPRFFTSDKLKHLEERRDGKHGKPSSPAYVGELDTYERTIAHEFMHVGMFGYSQKIVDFEGILWDDKPPVLIYGEPRCRDFAKRLDNGKPNLLVAVNADTYSWFYTYYYFDKQWGWTTKHDELKKGCNGHLLCTIEEIQTGEPNSRYPGIDTPEPSFPAQEKDVKFDSNKPLPCQDSDQKDSHGNPVVVCEFIGGNYEEWVDQLDKPFKSTAGCDLSSQCHLKNKILWSHPDCTCTCDGKQTSLHDHRCAGYEGVSIGFR